MWFVEPHPFPERYLPPDWARRDNKVTKGDRVDRTVEISSLHNTMIKNTVFWTWGLIVWQTLPTFLRNINRSSYLITRRRIPKSRALSTSQTTDQWSEEISTTRCWCVFKNTGNFVLTLLHLNQQVCSFGTPCQGSYGWLTVVCLAQWPQAERGVVQPMCRFTCTELLCVVHKIFKSSNHQWLWFVF